MKCIELHLAFTFDMFSLQLRRGANFFFGENEIISIRVEKQNKSTNTTFTLDITCIISTWSRQQRTGLGNIAASYNLKRAVLRFIPFPMAFRFKITSNTSCFFGLYICVLHFFPSTLCVCVCVMNEWKLNLLFNDLLPC